MILDLEETFKRIAGIVSGDYDPDEYIYGLEERDDLPDSFADLDFWKGEERPQQDPLGPQMDAFAPENRAFVQHGVGRWKKDYENGRIPEEALKGVGGGYMLRSDAAKSFLDAQRQAGISFGLNSAYRTFESQEALYAAYVRGEGNLAAEPGHSDHGWGLAIDADDATQKFLENHPEYGWKQTVEGEPWHFEYTGGYDAAYRKKRTRKAAPQVSEPMLPEFDLSEPDPLLDFSGAMSSLLFEGFAAPPRKPRTKDTGGTVLPDWVPKQYHGWITEAARRFGVSPALIAYVGKSESGWRPSLTSSAGAQGLMQTMPFWSDDASDPFGSFDAQNNERKNILLGAWILAHYIKAARGNVREGLAHYNGGNDPPSSSYAYADTILKGLRGG